VRGARVVWSATTVGCDAGEELEVGDSADRWARSVSKRGGRGRCGGGLRDRWAKLGHADEIDRRAGEEKEKKRGRKGR
jgi:hypothetical protein